MNWKIQVPFRKIKKHLDLAHKKIATADFAHISLFSESSELIHIVGPHALHYFGLSESLRAAKSIYKINPSEIIITNDPSLGSPRLCDLTFIKAYQKGYCAIQVSIKELLNTPKIFKANSNSDEGFKIPPTPLDTQGMVEKALMDYLTQSHISLDKLKQIFTEVKSTFDFIEPLLATLKPADLKDLNHYTEELLKKNLQRFPDGDFSHQVSNEINLKLKIKDKALTVQFPQAAKESVQGNLNIHYFLTASTCLWFFLSLTGEEIPINEGTLKAISIEAPLGTLVNCSQNRATFLGYYLTTQLILKGLVEIYKKLFSQETKNIHFLASTHLLLKAQNQIGVFVFGHGTPASTFLKGYTNIITDFHNIKNPSIEDFENEHLGLVQSYYLNQNTDEDVSQSGGCGTKFDLTLLAPVEVCALGHFAGKSKTSQNIIKSFNAQETLLVQTPFGENFKISSE